MYVEGNEREKWIKMAEDPMVRKRTSRDGSAGSNIRI
jgi:hypothetical protein